MAQSVIESLFGDDPFFDGAYLLWPRRTATLTSVRDDFFRRRAQLMENFKADLCDVLPRDLFQKLDDLCSSSSSLSKSDRALSLTLDTQGLLPEDISVTVSGRTLEVMAGKSTPADPPGGPDSKPTGFIKRVSLPSHVDPASLTCTLGDDGLLRIESQIQKPASEERLVPIRFRTSLDFPITKDNTNKTEDSLDKST